MPSPFGFSYGDGDSTHFLNGSGSFTVVPTSISGSNIAFLENTQEFTGANTFAKTSGSAQVIIIGTSSSTSSNALHITTTFTGSTLNKGIYVAPSQAVISSVGFYGLDTRPQFSSTASGPQSSIFGLISIPTILSSTTASMTNVYGGYFRIDHNTTASAVITSGYGIDIASPNFGASGSGTITTLYGLKVENMTTGGTNYAIYTGTGKVRFGDNVLIGTSTDGMTANGSVAISQDLAHRGSKAGFFNTAPITKPTGVAVTAAGIHAALVSLGLIAA